MSLVMLRMMLFFSMCLPLSASVCLTPWEQEPSKLLKRVAAGGAGIWGVDSNDDVFIRNDGVWENIVGKLKDISVGSSEIWGVDSNDDIFKRTLNSDWNHISGKLKQISVSQQNTVWGVDSTDAIFRRDGNNWKHIDGLLKVVSVGPSGVWGVNHVDDIFYRTGTYGDTNTDGSGWQHINGKLKWISVGNNIVFGVNSNDEIFYRVGISPQNPVGTGWQHIDGKLSQIDVFDSAVWGVDSADNVHSSQIVYPGKYRVYSFQEDWTTAREQCNADGLQFAMIKNEADSTQLKQDISATLDAPDDFEGRRYWRSKNWVWIGGTDEEVEGDWKWIDTGEEIDTDAQFLQWAGKPGKQPDNKQNKQGQRQHYLAISRVDGKLDDKFLEKKNFFACQCEVAPEPTQAPTAASTAVSTGKTSTSEIPRLTTERPTSGTNVFPRRR